MTNRPIIGVDFSGAALAGEKIWIARAHFQDEMLVFDELLPAHALPEGAPQREAALAALVNYIGSFQAPICGFDFPFSLHHDELDRFNWRDWVASLPARFDSSDAFRAAYKGAKRATDVRAKTPFAPLNLRLYRQTYHGIRDVLAPLLQNGAVALPFDEPRASQPRAAWLLEICPASLLKKHQLYFSYKGKSEAQRLNRERILSECQTRFALKTSDAMKQNALDDTEGDALDAILSALCVAQALQKAEWTPRDEAEKLEGRVYF